MKEITEEKKEVTEEKKVAMRGFLKRMIEEHKELVVRTQKLHNYIYGNGGQNDDKDEFANKCLQLRGMKLYEEALRARLNNNGIVFENGVYFNAIDKINYNL